MPRPSPTKPTEAELAILHILWKNGPSTVRQVQEALGKSRKTGYTTALKFLQIMAKKQLVDRDESAHAHVYRARLDREQTQGQLVGDLVQRAFGGSAAQLAMRALSSQRADPEELAQIRKFLDELEGDAS